MKKILFSMASLMILASSVQANPLWKWSLDGNLRDAITGSEATAVGTPVYISGVKGQALAFAGDSAVSFNANKAALENFSLSAWVRSHENKLQGRILEKGASNSLWLYATQGLVVGGFYDAKRVKYLDVTSAEDLLDGEWHHVVVTFDGARLSLFIDGQLENSVRVPSGSMPNVNNEPVVIGSKYKGQAHDNLVGAVDEVTVYSRALTPAEIESAYRSVVAR